MGKRRCSRADDGFICAVCGVTQNRPRKKGLSRGLEEAEDFS